MDIDFEMLGQDKVVISLKDFENMMDVIAYDEAKSKTQRHFEVDLTLKIIQGEPPLRAFRKHHGFSQSQLSKKSGVPQGLISEIERGKKQGSITTLKSLANVLNIDVDDLL